MHTYDFHIRQTHIPKKNRRALPRACQITSFQHDVAFELLFRCVVAWVFATTFNMMFEMCYFFINLSTRVTFFAPISNKKCNDCEKCCNCCWIVAQTVVSCRVSAHARRGLQEPAGTDIVASLTWRWPLFLTYFPKPLFSQKYQFCDPQAPILPPFWYPFSSFFEAQGLLDF